MQRWIQHLLKSTKNWVSDRPAEPKTGVPHRPVAPKTGVPHRTVATKTGVPHRPRWYLDLEGVMGRLGCVLGCLGRVLGASWGVLGASWGHLGASWGRPGASWWLLGASLDRKKIYLAWIRFPYRCLLDFRPKLRPPKIKKDIGFSLVFITFLRKQPLKVNIKF